MNKDQNVNDVIQGALNQIMLTMKPVDTQESGDLICYAMTKMVEIIAVIGGREQAQSVLAEMSKHVAGCKLPEVQLVPSKASSSVPGNKTAH